MRSVPVGHSLSALPPTPRAWHVFATSDPGASLHPRLYAVVRLADSEVRYSKASIIAACKKKELSNKMPESKSLTGRETS
jgi:hypothetical protein